MTTHLHRFTRILVTIFALVTSLAFVEAAEGQCPGTVLTSGLQLPSKIIQTPRDNLIVAETGTFVPNSGRISIVDEHGNRRTLLNGLPSGISEVGDPSGPGGLYLKGRTLYVVNGEGDATLAGPVPGTEVPNPAPSSPILSSVLALHFSVDVERMTHGFTLTLADHQSLKNGQKLKLNNGHGDRITLELIADFPDYTPDPLPFFQPNVRHSNPFGITKLGGDLFVVDGGQNSVLRVDINTGSSSILTTFPPIPNPVFPGLGGPFIEAVPDGIRKFRGQLYVTLLRGFPFLSGNAAVMKVNPGTGAITPFIGGLTSAIDVLPDKNPGRTSYLTLEISTNLLVGEPGRLQRFASPGGPGTVISNCLISPSSMVLDPDEDDDDWDYRDADHGSPPPRDTLYVTEIFTGNIIKIRVH